MSRWPPGTGNKGYRNQLKEQKRLEAEERINAKSEKAKEFYYHVYTNADISYSLAALEARLITAGITEEQIKNNQHIIDLIVCAIENANLDCD